MRIVLTADDFGLSDDTVRSTIDCFERGGLTSASIMPASPAVERALEFARAHPEFSFGVHLTFAGDNNDHSVADPRHLPAMVTDRGLFPPYKTVRRRAILRQIPAAQIEMELEAQINRVRSAGVKVSYVDSHFHLHKFGPFHAAMRRVLPRLGITRVRSVQNIYLKKPLRTFSFWYGPIRRLHIRRRFITTDHFYMPTSSFEHNWHSLLLERLPSESTDSLEIGVHPGYVDFWRSDERAGVLRFAEAAKAQGHELVGWGRI